MNQSVTFNVNGIKCGGCETTINKALQALAGVVAVQASSQDKAVSVQFDADLTSPAAIKDAIITAGYPVQDNG